MFDGRVEMLRLIQLWLMSFVELLVKDYSLLYVFGIVNVETELFNDD